MNKDDFVDNYVDLYKHEDLLIWTKLKFIIGFNSSLLAAWAITKNEGNILNLELPRILIPAIGCITSLLLMVTVINGRKYLQIHARQWRPYLYPETDQSRLLFGYGFHSTSMVTVYFSLTPALLWVVAFFVG